MLTVRSDGERRGLPSFPPHFLPLHPASLFNGSTNVRGGVGGGALGFVPSAEIQRQEIHHLPSRSSHSSWGAGQRGPGFLHGGDGLAGRGWLGARAELEHSGTGLSQVVERLRLDWLPKYGLWMSARINQSGPIDCAP